MNQEEQNVRDEREEKLDGELQVQKSPVLAWLDNFWYHYKWHTIITVFFVTVLTLCLVQLFDRPKYDVNFVMAGTYRLDNEQVADYHKVLSQLLPEDYDGDGEKSVNIMAYQIYSDADAAEEKSKAEAESQQYVFNVKFNNDEMNNFTQYTMTGDCSVYLLSPYLYKSLVSDERLLPMSELYTGKNLPTGVTEDGYGININQTHFYQYNPAAQAMPDDMILCILKPLVWGDSSKQENYDKEKAFFCAIADYQVKE